MSPRLSPALACGLISLAFTPMKTAVLPTRAPETITANDNRQPAGQLKAGVLTVHLEARRGMWYPEGPNSVGVETAAWAELGKPTRNPGPLLRVPVGTTVQAMVHNSLSKPLTVYGLAAQRGAKDSTVIPPGQAQSFEFKATTAGTYYYAGQTVPGPIDARVDEDSQLNGAIVVDPAGAAVRDRILMISWWFILDSTSASGLKRGTMSINGLSWPHTEKFDLVQNDSVHWRVINATPIDHPMHLHGFYYRIDAKGDGVRDTVLAPRDQRMVVTEIMGPRQTMEMSWVPTRPGNWIFHCHFAGHLSYHVAMDTDKGVAHPENDEHHMGGDAPHQMYGLVIGLRVAPRGALALAPTEGRPIRLIIREKANVYGDKPGYAFVLGGTPAEKDQNMLPVPGPALVLERGKPVAITIVNQAKDRAAVHWHGIELQSYPDGVPGWSGSGKEILPSVAPNDSIVVRFTPPRAGTFMYHSHFNEFQQITSGLYGPIIVLEPGQKLDPERDRVLIISSAGQPTNVVTGLTPMMINGQTKPAPMDFKAGVNYRLRLIGITGDDPIEFKLTAAGDKPVQWRALARDGMDLPKSQAVMRPAAMYFDPGMIFDFEFSPKSAGDLTLQYGLPAFIFPPNQAPPQTKVQVRVH